MIAKAIILLVAFLLILTPVAPAFAQEADIPAAQPTDAPAVPDAVPVVETPTDITDPATGSTEIPSADSGTTVDAPAVDAPTEETPTEEAPPEEDIANPDSEALLSAPASEPQDQVLGKYVAPQVSAVDGALQYEYPISVPPGRNGLNPNLSFVYNSNNRSKDTIIAMGWSFNIPYIQRVNKKGTDRLYTDNYFISSTDGELVSQGSGIYTPRTENGAFNKYVLASNTWTVTDKKGTDYVFGSSAATRQDDPNDSTKIFSWMLESVTDTNGNTISYSYYKDQGQIYPSSISYNQGGPFSILFNRTSRSVPVTTNAPAFQVKTAYYISQVKVQINATDVAKYDLSVSNDLIQSITLTGYDESAASLSLPSTNLSYEVSGDNFARSSSWEAPTYIDGGIEKWSGLSGQSLATVDVNGDGLIDLVRTSGGDPYSSTDTRYGVWLNTGSDFVRSTTFKAPTYMDNGVEKWPYLNTSNTVMVDVNGDGLTDFIRSNGGAFGNVYNSSDTKYGIWINTGTDFTRSSTWKVPTYFITGTEYYSFVNDSSDLMVDANGDGLVDLLRSSGDNTYVSSDTQFGLWANTGSAFTRSSNFKGPTYIDGGIEKWSYLSDPSTTMADVNGDGLTDLVRTAGDNTYNSSDVKYGVWLNTGLGFTRSTTWKAPTYMDAGVEKWSYLNTTNIVMVDVNGDGLTDFIRSNGGSFGNAYNSSDTRYGIWISTGNGFTRSSSWKVPTYFQSGTEYYSFVNDSSDLMADIDADGPIDLFRSSKDNTYVSSDPMFGVWVNSSTNFSEIVEIENPKGGTTSIEYINPKIQDSSNIAPVRMSAVSAVTTDDGNGNVDTTTYDYRDADYYYNDAFDRRFGGFGQVIETDPAGNVKTTKYHQANGQTGNEPTDSYAQIGKPYENTIKDGSNNTYLLNRTNYTETSLGGTSKSILVSSEVSLQYDGVSSHTDKATAYTYDTYGNKTQEVQYGQVTGAADGTFTDTGTDKSTEDILYAANTTDYVVGLPYQDTVTDQSAVKVRESKMYYDTLSLGSIGAGNQTKVEQWKTSSTYINSQKSYGSYGLVATSTDPRGKVTTYTTYDSYNLYPITITDPLSQTVQYTYDYSIGKPKQVTDQNGFVYQTIYDGLDRVTAEKIPDFSSPYSAITKTAYTYTDTRGAVKIQRTDNLDGSTSADTYQYFDGFDRIIQERKEAESSGTYNVKDTVYNDVGLVLKQSIPYTSNGSTKTSKTTSSALYTSYTYDPLKRTLTKDDANGTTSYDYDGWKTIVTDAESHTKNYYNDAYSNLVKVDEINGASTYTTNYEYNLNNKLTKITDALSNIRNFTYDGLGRRLTAQDLHASGDATYGTWTYAYDDAGNLTQSVSPNAATTNFTYNDINQQLTEDYTGAGGTEISYTYGGCTNGVGKLCSVTMSSGANTSYTYNSNGIVASEAKTINGTAYTTSYTYDRQGNKLVITYPDSAEAKYTYNTAGLLEKVERKESGGAYTNVVSNFDYNPADLVKTQTDANGLITTNTYDAGHLYRLVNKQTANPYYVPPSNHVPTITLSGSSIININLGGTYTEPGYSASDTEDGTITGLVTITGSVNTAVAGVYNLTYNVEDSYGVPAARKVRTVKVWPAATAKALIIGGGGGGGKGAARQGGGGGAGAYIENNSVTVNYGANSIVIGSGGAGATTTSSNGAIGNSSTAFGLTAVGGGGGASSSGTNGSNGGSGGGAAGGGSGSNGTGGTATSGQGNNGGAGFGSGTSNNRSGGGGGGAGAVGGNSTSGAGAAGGAGAASSITGTSVTRAGGGGGSGTSSGAGGSGGGGKGSSSTVTGDAGTANTGGGGGGGNATNNFNGKNGGSGIVIIAYKTNGDDRLSTSSTGGTVTTSGAYTIHTFTSSGTFTGVGVVPTVNNPTITLTGTDRYEKTVGDSWSEPGYSATDTEDGTLTGSVTVTGSVNTSIAGTYQLVYNVTDSSGAPAAAKIRTVFVKPSGSTPTYLQNLTYSYDNVGNITQIIDGSDTSSSKTANYIYDPLYRLTSATITSVASGQSTYTHTFTYDAIGNISTGPIGSYTYAGTNYANPHAATTINGATYSYDNDGNVTGNGTLANTWNYKDQLTQAVTGGVTSSYLFDHTGERVSLANGTTTTAYANDLYNTDGTKKTKQVYANGSLVATVETVSGTVTPYYNHTDQLGSVTNVSDGSGASVETLDYYPLGNQRISTGSHTDQRQYIGEVYDTNTGLDYLNARFYKADIGRFISQDPTFLAIGNNGEIKQLTGQDLQQFLSDPQNLNSYTYARNNPMLYMDPNGQFWNPFNSIQGAWFTKVGNVANSYAKYDPVFNYTTSHAWVGYAAGGVGIAAGGAAGALAGLGALGITSIGSACVAFCNQSTNLVNTAGPATGNAINITSQGMLHIQENHTLTSNVPFETGRSFFYNPKEISGLIQKAQNVPAQLQEHGTYSRVVDAGRQIGWDRATQGATSFYTVISDKAGNLITSFPGLPSKLTK